MANDYVALATITLTSTDTEVVFSSIPNTYRDLIVVCQWGLTGSGDTIAGFRLNGATSGYTNVTMFGDTSPSPGSDTRTSDNLSFIWRIGNDNTTNSTTIIQIFDYATDKHKTTLARNNGLANSFVSATAGRWASTDAVNSVALRPWNGGNIASGSTFSLYGIAS